MTTAALPRPATIRPDARLGFGGILRSEWIKLRSLRSTWWSLGLILVLSIGLSLVMVTTITWEPGVDAAADAQTARTAAMVGLTFGQLIAAVFGVLVVSGEYSSGMIRTTLAAVPTRLPVLAAKAVVLFAAVALTGLVTLFGAWAVVTPILAGQGLDVSLLDGGVAVALANGAAYLGLTALFAFGLGTVLRSAAGGIATALGVILVVPIVMPLLALAAPWAADVEPFMFSSAGSAMTDIPGTTVADPAGGIVLEPWQGALVTLAWTAASLLLGALALRRRDA